MNVTDHPELEVLQGYLNNSASAEFSSLRMHLAQCSQCRTLLDGLTGLKDISQLNTNTLTETQHQQIDDFINDRLHGNEKVSTQALIDSKPEAMKTALHYASLQAAQNRTSKNSSNSASSALLAANSSTWSTIKSKLKSLFSYQTPIWITAPTAAAVVALLSFNLYEKSNEELNYTIASYQDNEIIQFRSKNSLPGIGFFAKSENQTMHFSGVNITLTDNRNFNINWPAIDKAVKYNIRLQVFDQGIKKLIGNVTTDMNSVLITSQLNNINHRYEWVLTGETSDNLTFMANGGFVINNSEKGHLR